MPADRDDRTPAPLPAAPVVVVAAAILDDDGRLLAAQRAYPSAMAGGWELPGGKVEPGERVEDALVRECTEELGVRIELVDRLPGAYPLGDAGASMLVWTARIVAGVPEALDDHEQVLWLAPADWDSVGWLPADVQVVVDLRRLLGG